MSFWSSLASLFRRTPPISSGSSGSSSAVQPPSLYHVARALQALGAADPSVWATTLHAPMLRYGINTPRRAAAFLATVAHESGGLRRLSEDMHYSAARIAVVWPSRFSGPAQAAAYANNPEGLANKVYASRMGNGDEASGDGWKFRGAGLIQLTGKANYAALAKAFGKGVMDTAAWVRTREGAAISAAWWWSANSCNELADANDIAAWRRRVNGGLIGLEDVVVKYGMALEAMG